MAGHLVVVVHGIGEQEAGETVDAVLAGAIADHERIAPGEPVTVETEIMEVPRHPFGTIRKDAPEPDSKEAREVPHFPMHMRHVRSVDRPQDPATTFVDMYWADISPAPNGQFQTFLDFVRTLLSIGYLAMENARSHGQRLSYRIVHAFVWCFFAGIAAINLMLLIGLGLLLLDGSAFGIMPSKGGVPMFYYTRAPDVAFHFWVRQEILIALTGFATLGLGWWLSRRKLKTQLVSQFADGLIWVGGLVVVFALFTIFAPGSAQALFGEVTGHYSDLHRFVDVVVVGLSHLWMAALLMCVALYFTSLREARADAKEAAKLVEALKEKGVPEPDRIRESDSPVRIYASVCSALVLLWMVFISSFWVFVEAVIRRQRPDDGSDADKTAEEVQERVVNSAETAVFRDSDAYLPFDLSQLLDTELAEALGGMTTAVALLFMLFLVTATVLIRRHVNKDALHKQDHEKARRLLLNVRLQWAFLLSTPTIAIVSAFNMAKYHQWAEPGLEWLYRFVPGLETVLLGLLNIVTNAKNFDGFASIVLLVLAGVVFYRHSTVGGALGVVRDITVYSTTREMEPLPSRDLRETGEDENDNFPIRCRIEDRFTRVLELMLWSKKPDRVTIVSHSLGTIVATRCLGRWLKDNDLPGGGTLVTMGSPATHIYRRYFPHSFEVKKPLLEKMTWVNIFRTDDFVGTWIDGLKPPPTNRNVPPAGHSGYFTDEKVWRYLREDAHLRLKPLSAPPPSPPSEEDGGGAEAPTSRGEGGVAQNQDTQPAGGEDDRA